MRVEALAVIDTNVVVSGVLAPASSPTARILDAMLSGRLRFAISIELMAEWRAVLLRRKVRQRHGLSAGDVDRILADLARWAVVVEPVRSSVESPDPGDQFLCDLVATVENSVLVTGDGGLVDTGLPFEVMTPADFEAEL